MIGSLDLQLVEGSLLMSSSVLQGPHLVLHPKEMPRDFGLAAYKRAFGRASFRTVRLAFGLHAQNSKQGPEDHTGSSAQESNTTQKNLRPEAEGNRSVGQQIDAACKGCLSSGQSPDHPAGNTPPPPCTNLP